MELTTIMQGIIRTRSAVRAKKRDTYTTYFLKKKWNNKMKDDVLWWCYKKLFLTWFLFILAFHAVFGYKDAENRTIL